jgi:hypothetical protein
MALHLWDTRRNTIRKRGRGEGTPGIQEGRLCSQMAETSSHGSLLKRSNAPPLRRIGWADLRRLGENKTGSPLLGSIAARLQVGDTRLVAGVGTVWLLTPALR